MDLVRKWGLLLLVGCFLGAEPPDDPVMKARSQRSQAQGVEEADLPPVPRGVMEPPPLPPPEIHAKDSPHPQVAKPVRRKGGKVRAGRQARAAAPDPAPEETPAPTGRRARAAARTGRSAKATGATPAPKVRSAKRARPVGKAGKPAKRSGKRVKA
jgi:hypothetical protein